MDCWFPYCLFFFSGEKFEILLVDEFYFCFFYSAVYLMFRLFAGKNFCMAQIEQLCETPVDKISSEKIQSIVLFLQRSEGLSKHVDSFMQMLSLLQLKDDESSFVLSPLLSNELRDDNFLRYYYYSNRLLDDNPLSCLSYSFVMIKCILFTR